MHPYRTVPLQLRHTLRPLLADSNLVSFSPPLGGFSPYPSQIFRLRQYGMPRPNHRYLLINITIRPLTHSSKHVALSSLLLVSLLFQRTGLLFRYCVPFVLVEGFLKDDES
jgi:hypothetical protein